MRQRQDTRGTVVDVQQIIDRILSSPRAQANRAFEGRTFADEPIIRRGSQMANYLPPRCQQMRNIATAPEARFKPEAWVFYQQARFMEDYEDNVPYHGAFEHYFPTYQAMSDRQLRGYFTWRAAVRRGEVWKTSLSFVFVYLYELLCGIGTTPGVEGFRVIERFWWQYREYEPRIDRYVRTWLRDYAVWHDLPHTFVEPYVHLEFDHALVALRDGIAGWYGERREARFSTPVSLLVTHGAQAAAAASGAASSADSPAAQLPQQAPAKRRPPKPDGTPRACEEALFEALDHLSSYRPRVSRLHKDRPETFRHVCCAVLARLSYHYDTHRKTGLLESLFGSPLAMPHEMFTSAVFWTNVPHPDAVYELDEVNRYTCARGRWYWEGYHGSHNRSPELGRVLRVVDQRLRAAIGYEHPLAEKPAPKYLAKIIDGEIGARLAWEREQEARTIHVDLSQLAGIRAAASVTREALLVDEEREEGPAPADEAWAKDDATPSSKPDTSDATAAAPKPMCGAQTAQPSDTPALFGKDADAEPESVAGEYPSIAAEAPANQASIGDEPPAGDVTASATAPFGLTPTELALIDALLDGQSFEPPVGTSLDMLVDSVNEKLFDLLGDTALEFDVSGRPTIIEDYLEDVRGAIRP